MKKQKIIISSIWVLLLLSSCEDFLTVTPDLKETNDLVLSSYDGLLSAAAAAYAPLGDNYWYMADYTIIADLKGGNAKISPVTSGRYMTEYLWNNLPSSTTNVWEYAYYTISQTNNVINALDGFEEVGVEQEDLNALEGEMRFLRALSYFDMVRVYCPNYTDSDNNKYGLPIVTTTEKGSPSRNTVTETYDFIVKDLIYAYNNLSTSPIHTGSDSNAYATKWAAEALLARAYLSMEKWQSAANYATNVIDSCGYRLYTADEFSIADSGGVWGTTGAEEIIFEVYGADGNYYSPAWTNMAYLLSPDGYGDIGASADVMDLYEEDDVRLNMFTNTSSYPNDYWSTKYPGKDGDNTLADVPVLRLSEMYLIRAEAIQNGANVSGTTTVDDLNSIRSNRGASELSSATFNDVYKERRRELCFEGHELFDLKRTERDLERTDFDGTVNQNIEYPNYKWNMPIPQEELDANPNIEQNPNY